MIDVDYIEILDDNGNEYTYELVSTFNIAGYSYNYVLYKELDSDKYYLARYTGTSMSFLDTNLSLEEIRLAKELFEGNE